MRAYELELLEPIETLIKTICESKGADPLVGRRFLIQAAAARIGNVPFYPLLSVLGNEMPSELRSFVWDRSHDVAVALRNTQIPPALAVASLLRRKMDHMTRRRSGSYLTDFRLSTYLMRRLAAKLSPGSRIVDPAVGTGSFLAALASEGSRIWNMSVSQITGQCLYGADLSSDAICAAVWSLAAAGSDIESLELLRSHLLVADSLTQGKELWAGCPNGFDAVVGNPPWERLKLTRHEYLKDMGISRHYGDTYESYESLGAWHDEFIQSKNSLDEYRRLLRSKYVMQGNGEDDLYKLFLELSFALVKAQGGHISMLVPAGLIRSSGAHTLMRHLFLATNELNLMVFFNRPRFFDIDTRFKFVTLEATTGTDSCKKMCICSGDGDGRRAFSTSEVTIDRSELAAIHADLTIPEIRSTDEWKMFQYLHCVGQPFGSVESLWRPQIVREIDMTGDRHYFSAIPGASMLPIIEGRMIHQYKHNAKVYLEGTGRKAQWLPPISECPCEIRPQFWFPEEELRPEIKYRVKQSRVGFCDITGQTNERTLLAAPIPAGTVCGNKVPTITFLDGPEWLQWTWLAYANSFLLDWALRRIVTTSVNYFIIRSLPLISPTASSGQNLRLASLSKRLSCPTHFECEQVNQLSDMETAEIRAEIEWRVLGVYGLDASALGIILADFPLLDRGEPPLDGEDRSTVTADLVALRAIQNLGGKLELRDNLMGMDELTERVARALARGARAFRPSQLTIARQRLQVQPKRRELSLAPGIDHTLDPDYTGTVV